MKKKQAQIDHLQKKNEEYQNMVREESNRAQLDHLVAVVATQGMNLFFFLRMQNFCLHKGHARS